MKVGDLIRWCDWESTGGIAAPEDVLGIIVRYIPQETLPNLFEVMTSSGALIVEYSDELDIVKIEK